MLIAVDVDQYANKYIVYILCMRFLWKSLARKMILVLRNFLVVI